MAFTITYSPEAVEHLQALTKADQVLAVEKIEIQRTHGPTHPTRKRKLLRPNQIAPWELRLGNVRVFYDVDEQRNVVDIMAVGMKRHNELWIGGEKIVL